MPHHRFCRVLVLFFFSLYAVSPIVYATTANIPAASPANDTSISSTKLYLFEVLYDAIAGSDDKDDKEPAHHILVVKKKALHRVRTDGVDAARSAPKAALALPAPPLMDAASRREPRPLRPFPAPPFLTLHPVRTLLRPDPQLQERRTPWDSSTNL
jgi:hypothetical protein